MTRRASIILLALALLACYAPASANPPCTTSGELGPVGFQQLTVSTTSTALTVPTNAVFAVVIVATNAINARDDGTAPTATVGMPYGAGFPQAFTICGSAALSGTKLIRRGGSDAEVDVSYYK